MNPNIVADLIFIGAIVVGIGVLCIAGIIVGDILEQKSHRK